jgi:hypothetical protein
MVVALEIRLAMLRSRGDVSSDLVDRSAEAGEFVLALDGTTVDTAVVTADPIGRSEDAG